MCFGGGASRGQRDAEQGVGAEATLVLGSVDLDQLRIEGALGADVESAEGVRELAVDVADRAEDAEAAEAVAAVTKLDGLVGAGRASRGDVGAPGRAAFELDVDPDGRKAAAVEYLARPQLK